MLRLAMCKVFKLQAMQAELHIVRERQVEPQMHAIDCRDIIVFWRAHSLAGGQRGSYLLGRDLEGVLTLTGSVEEYFMHLNSLFRM